jgi:hypothetical protein
MPPFTLTEDERQLLFRQDPDTGSNGGWQGLLVKLQNHYNPATREISLDAEDLRRIPAYAFDYGRGGWEARLTGIFGRVLGPRLGR